MAEDKKKIEQKVEEKGVGPTEESTSVWHIITKQGKEYDILTDWKSLGEALDALQDPDTAEQFIGGLCITPDKLDMGEGEAPILYNFVMIRKSDIVSIAGSF
jgi:hypothetical protein